MMNLHELDSGGTWIDLLDPTAEEMAQVHERYHVRIASRDELDEVESSSRLAREKDVLYLSLPLATVADDGIITPSPMGFVLSDTLIVTIHFARLHTTAAVLTRLEAGKDKVSPPDIFAMVIEGMVDYSADQLETISADLMKISQRVFRRRRASRADIKEMNSLLHDMLSAIGYAGEQLSQIRETLLGLQRIITYTLETCRAWKDQDFLSDLNTARHDLQSLIEHGTHLSDKAQFLLDANLGFINTQQNDIFKVLTIVSVVGIPPTLIASMYGMNFHNMPELSWSWGYWYGLGLIALSTILPIAWFKWRGWW
jgi:magnesium transporter